MALYEYSSLCLATEPPQSGFKLKFNLDILFTPCDTGCFRRFCLWFRPSHNGISVDELVFEVDSSGETLCIFRSFKSDDGQRALFGSEYYLPRSEVGTLKVCVDKRPEEAYYFLVYNGNLLILEGRVSDSFDVLQLGCENAYSEIVRNTFPFPFTATEVECNVPLVFELTETSSTNYRSPSTDAFFIALTVGVAGSLFGPVRNERQNSGSERVLNVEESPAVETREMEYFDPSDSENKSVFTNGRLACLSFLVLVMLAALVFIVS